MAVLRSRNVLVATKLLAEALALAARWVVTVNGRLFPETRLIKSGYNHALQHDPRVTFRLVHRLNCSSTG